MKKIMLLSTLLAGLVSFEAGAVTTLNVNPTTGDITTTDPTITDLPAANIQAAYYGPDQNINIVSTTNRTWLNIANQWYVKSKTNYSLVINDDGTIPVPTGFTAAAGPYTAEPILVFEDINISETFE